MGVQALDRVGPVDVEVSCGGGVHRARLEGGRLRLLDHDLDAERALIGLGGDAPACVALADVWQAAVRSLDSAAPDPLDGLRRLEKPVPVELPWEPPADLDRAREPSRARRSLPAALDDALAQAAVLEAGERWGEGGESVPGRRTIQRFLSERMEAAFRLALQAVPAPRPTVRLALATRAAASDEPVEVDIDVARGHARVELTVPVRWLVDVDRARLATVGEAVVLDVVTGQGSDGLVVRAVRWERGDRELVPRPGLLLLDREQPGGAWRVAGPPGAAPRVDPWWSLHIGR